LARTERHIRTPPVSVSIQGCGVMVLGRPLSSLGSTAVDFDAATEMA
jgi:hypothetical protein